MALPKIAENIFINTKLYIYIHTKQSVSSIMRNILTIRNTQLNEFSPSHSQREEDTAADSRTNYTEWSSMYSSPVSTADQRPGPGATTSLPMPIHHFCPTFRLQVSPFLFTTYLTFKSYHQHYWFDNIIL